MLRSAACLPVLVSRMDDPAADVQQCAMSLVGNLLTDVFDPEARASLDIFAQAGGLPVLQAKLSEKIGVLKKKIQAINAGYNKLRGAFQKSQKDSETLLKKEATFKKLQTEVQKKHATDVRSVLVKIKAIRVREAQ